MSFSQPFCCQGGQPGGRGLDRLSPCLRLRIFYSLPPAEQLRLALLSHQVAHLLALARLYTKLPCRGHSPIPSRWRF